MALDLLTWPDVHAAELAVADARARWEEAKRRCYIAPKGTLRARQEARDRAANALLQAELALQAEHRRVGDA